MQNDFNKIARVYDFLASLVFGKAIQNSQVWLLNFIPSGSKVLIIGGGSGWILPLLLQKKSNLDIVYLEASEKMLHLSRKQYLKAEKTQLCNIEFRLGTEQNLLPTEKFDIVFTGFFLDLFQPDKLQQIMFALNNVLKEGGNWLLADFAVENSTKIWQKVLLKTMVKFFKLTVNLQANHIPILGPEFEKLNLIPIQKKFFFSSLIQAVVYIKKN